MSTAFVILLAAPPGAGIAAQTEPPRVTSKAVEPFAQCFAAAQEREARPWSFVPSASGSGGTFSNLGAAGVREPYFLDVMDRGAVRVIRLSAAAGDRSVLRAVDHCI